MGDRGQRTMAEQFHSCSDHRPQAGQVETLEAISYQRAGAYQSEGLGRSPEKEMGGTPTGTLDPPCWGDPFGETMRNWNFMTFSEIPVSGHSGNDALFLNRCSNGTCRSLGKRATSGSSSTASGPRRSLPTSFSCVGTHYVGLLRSLGFWLCRKNIGSSTKSRPWRQDSLLLWYSQPGKPKYHLRKSSGPWKKGLLECPLLPGANSPQQKKGAYAPRELDTFILGIVRYQVGCSARFNDLQHTAPSTHRPCMVATFTYMVDPPL